MSPELKAEILEGAKAAFFEAMIDGWVGGENRRSKETKTADGHTIIEYVTEDGKFRVVDDFITTRLSDKSAGTTTIFFKEEGGLQTPVWWMSYGGHYPEGAISFLKSAIAKAYERKLFLGGRGLAKVISTRHEVNELKFHLIYINKWNGDFQSFNGVEEVLQNPLVGYDPELIGYHQYFGMSLL